jgi:hypothetical protein
MGIGLSLTTLERRSFTLWRPRSSSARWHRHTSARNPDHSVIRTAAAWVALVILLELVVVAGLLLQSLAIFQSPLGTWIPFAPIILSTVSVGQVRTRRSGVRGHSPV